MRLFLPVILTALALTPPALAQTASDCSRSLASGERTLCVEIVVDAAPEQVWALWAEPTQLATWLAPVAAIDMREGGMMEASYDPSQPLGDPRNILNRVVSVETGRSFALQVERAPPGFAHADEARALVTIISLEAAEGGTRVRTSMRGFREGEAYDALYAFFERGNAWTLQMLAARVTRGPTDWRAAMAEH